MNKKDFVSLKVANLLKEKKYITSCIAYYTDGKLKLRKYNAEGFEPHGVSVYYEHVNMGFVPDKEIVLAPMLMDVQRWLREVRNIHITVGNSASGYWWELSKADNGTMIYDYNYSGPNDAGKWDTYEEALDSAIFVALKYE